MRSVGCVVVGGGPAGLAAARTAARHGVRVLLVDENAELGGQYYRQMPDSFHAPGDAKPERIEWVQEKGDTKALNGWWTFEDLGGERTRATYGLAVDPGRVLGLLLRGPAEAKVRDFLLGGAADGLKDEAERGA